MWRCERPSVIHTQIYTLYLKESSNLMIKHEYDGVCRKFYESSVISKKRLLLERCCPNKY